MAPLNERLGYIVKMKRQRDRLTQNDLGARIGVSGSYISGVESGQTTVFSAFVVPVAGTTLYQTDLSLASLAVGEYVIDIKAKGTDGDAHDAVRFRVVP